MSGYAGPSLPKQPRGRQDFRIAIICALSSEAEMVELVMDKDWSDVPGTKYGKAPGDINTYTTGAIAGHNVVLAYMPGMGGNDAAAVASRLRSSFTKIEYAFVVGICGVVPVHHGTKENIVLGDCIISTAVIQYDFGRNYDTKFRRKGGLDTLGRADAGVRSFMAKWSTRTNRPKLVASLNYHLEKLLKSDPSIVFPGVEHDQVFPPSYMHSHRASDGPCDDCDKELKICNRECNLIGCKVERALDRTRNSTRSNIHFGRFGSANMVMKSGLIRDAIAKADELIAFEMEGAGVWDAFPATIVIKSACDYADSHKNKKWQEYSAASAAAGLKAVLSRLELPDLEHVAQDPMSPRIESNVLNEIEMNCLVAFFRPPSYADAKNRISDHVEGTCGWFLSQEAYRHWVNIEGGCLLVSADPGCGKSVLAKYLIDHELPRSSPHTTSTGDVSSSEDTIICYYFFEDQVQNRLAPALAAILHQLLSTSNRFLRTYALPLYEKHGDNLINDVGLMTEMICSIGNDQAFPSLILVIDALDECDQADCRRLFQQLQRLEETKQIKILLTSRPYDQIVSDFDYRAISSRVHIPGEQESEAIGQEVNLVIKHRLHDLYLRNRLDQELYHQLQEELISLKNRTYLWVYLVFDELDYGLKKTRKELQKFFATLPRSVNEAYDKILDRTTGDTDIRLLVQRTLNIMLAAGRILTVGEMQCAVKFQSLPATASFAELDLETEEDFAYKLRNWCGLFIQIYNGGVNFIHQTAREFLLAKRNTFMSGSVSDLNWRGTFSAEQAHTIMAQVCIVYILVCGQYDEESGTISDFSFLQYAALFWDRHFNESISAQDKIFCNIALAICSEENLLKVWKHLCYASQFEANDPTTKAFDRTLLMQGESLEMISALRTDAVLPLRIGKISQKSKPPAIDIDRALCAAARWGHINNLKLLLTYSAEMGYHANTVAPTKGFSSLHIGAIHGRIDVVEVLLQAGADANITDWKGFKPLARTIAWAPHPERLDIMELLLDHGGKVNTIGENLESALEWATTCSRPIETIALLLQRGADVNWQDNYGRSPLHSAFQQHVCLELLTNGADANLQNNQGMTPLHCFASSFAETSATLLEHGAKVELQDIYGMTPLHYCRSVETTALLLRHGANIHARDRRDCTALHSAVQDGCSKKTILVFLENNANVEAQDHLGMTPIQRAAYIGALNVLRLLLQHAANPDSQDKLGRTALHHALRRVDDYKEDTTENRHNMETGDAQSMYHAIPNYHYSGPDRDHSSTTDSPICLSRSDSFISIRLEESDSRELLDILHVLLEYSSDINLQDNYGATALSLAAKHRSLRAIEILLEYGADPNIHGQVVSNPLYLAIQEGRKEIIKCLLDHGLEDSTSAECVKLALVQAAEGKLACDPGCLEAVFESSKGVNFQFPSGSTLLDLAVELENREVVELLIKHGAVTSTSEHHGQIVLSHAPALVTEVSEL